MENSERIKNLSIFKVKSSFTVNYGLLSAIKNKWNFSRTGRQRKTRKQNWYDNEENLSNAALHKIIVENKYQPPTYENRIISYEVEPSEIQKLYKWPIFCYEKYKVEIASIQNKSVISSTLKTNCQRAKNNSDDLCYLCKSVQHTIQHMFLKCSHVALLWNEFFDWWS